MRCNRSCLRIKFDLAIRAACAALVLGLGSACGGAGAAGPTPTPPAGASVGGTTPAASPQRPALASPVASPSVAATGATPTATNTAEATGETYEVQSGDTLLSIAQQVYGDGTQWRRIYDANKDAIGSDPDRLKIGMKLTIPPKQS